MRNCFWSSGYLQHRSTIGYTYLLRRQTWGKFENLKTNCSRAVSCKHQRAPGTGSSSWLCIHIHPPLHRANMTPSGLPNKMKAKRIKRILVNYSYIATPRCLQPVSASNGGRHGAFMNSSLYFTHQAAVLQIFYRYTLWMISVCRQCNWWHIAP